MRIVQKGGDHCLKFFGSFGRSEYHESQNEDSCMYIKNELNSSFDNSVQDHIPNLGIPNNSMAQRKNENIFGNLKPDVSPRGSSRVLNFQNLN
jgi:hypothetical protein